MELSVGFGGDAQLSLLDRASVGIAVYDRDGLLARANAYHARLACGDRVPSRSAAGGRRWQGWAEDGRELSLAEFPCERAFRGEMVSPGIDLLHYGADGAGTWLNVSASPVRDPDGEAIVGVVLLFLQLHDRARSIGPGSAAGERFRQFAENSGSAIWIADGADGAFSYRNPRHRQLGGDAAAPLASLADWIARVEETDRAAVLAGYARVAAGETVRHEYRLAPVGRAAPRRLRETSFAIRDERDGLVMIAGITEDITPRPDRRLFFVGRGDAANPVAAAIRRADCHNVKVFASIRAFAEVAGFLSPGCVAVDLATVEDGAVELPPLLAAHAATRPIVVIGRPETSAAAAVSVMRAGAADYLVPPFADEGLVDALLDAAARFGSAPAEPVPAPAAAPRRVTLSPREKDVLEGLRSGGTNKSIGRDLGISPRTVEAHRSRLMERLHAGSLAELLRAAV